MKHFLDVFSLSIQSQQLFHLMKYHCFNSIERRNDAFGFECYLRQYSMPLQMYWFPLNSINLEGYLSKLAQHLIFLEQLFKQKLLEIEVNH